MKHQYVGDVSDFRKHALLRALAQGGKVRIGVSWMLTRDDDRPDGRKLAYLDEPERWRAIDPPLFDLLRQVVDVPDSRRLSLIEGSGIIPGAVYDDALVPDDRAGRETWFARSRAALAEVDLVFFDPDNGIEVASKPIGRKGSSKFVALSELADTYAAGKSVVVYQHFAREERRAHLDRLSGALYSAAPGADRWIVETAHVAFLLLVQPSHQSLLPVETLLTARLRGPRMFRTVTRIVGTGP